MRNPWKKLSSRRVYTNKWIEVKEDKVIQPDNRPGIFAYLRVKPGIAVLPIDDEGFVYLIEEYHYPTHTTLLKPVSGGIDGDETPLQAAKRELREELGIDAKRWTALGSTNAFASTVDAEARLFLAQGLAFKKPNLEGTEAIQPVRILWKEAVEQVISGKITDGNTCILLLKAYHHLRQDPQ